MSTSPGIITQWNFNSTTPDASTVTGTTNPSTGNGTIRWKNVRLCCIGKNRNIRSVAAYGGDNGSEGIIFITAANSPISSPIVILANEVSSTLSFFTVVSSVVDISFADIQAKNIGSQNMVAWQTASEDASDVFEIERSKNGTSYEYVATKNATGSASAYSYIDVAPFEGITYYRLKMKHSSGAVNYSPVVTATLKGRTTIVRVYPNPVSDMLRITVTGMQIENTYAELLNMQGAVVKRIKLAQQTAPDISNLPAGIYT